ncbi:hypothetical protein RDI58_004167 [Solanum bulbocastanum]|uniref:Ulp1 protease family, C-terminal catalytic domain containing protein n=1 Tax=Solanum bulbocastanum TaxID=147425 RepID=A0AAN8YLF7_SOLBU
MIVLTFSQLPRKSDHLIYSSNVNHEEVQPQEVPGFEDFSSKPPKQLLRRSTRVVGAGSTPPSREESDCKMYVSAFAEFLSDEINIPSTRFRSDYLCKRYATLLWKYGMDKAKAGYVSDNDDPTRRKNDYTSPAEDGLINVE